MREGRKERSVTDRREGRMEKGALKGKRSKEEMSGEGRDNKRRKEDRKAYLKGMLVFDF